MFKVNLILLSSISLILLIMSGLIYIKHQSNIIKSYEDAKKIYEIRMDDFNLIQMKLLKGVNDEKIDTNHTLTSNPISL